jgi:hypothetical protein
MQIVISCPTETLIPDNLSMLRGTPLAEPSENKNVLDWLVACKDVASREIGRYRNK